MQATSPLFGPPSLTAGLIATQALVYPWDLPAANGLLEFNFPLDLCQTAAGLVTATGTIYLLGFTSRNGALFTNANLYVATAGNTLTTNESFVGLYSANGQTQLGITADQSTAWASTGLIASALTTPYQLVAGTFYWLAVLSVGTGAPKFAGSLANIPIRNAGLTTANYAFCVNGTTQTALPSTFTIASNTQTGAFPFWFGVT